MTYQDSYLIVEYLHDKLQAVYSYNRELTEKESEDFQAMDESEILASGFKFERIYDPNPPIVE